jgi:hypothetical protein
MGFLLRRSAMANEGCDIERDQPCSRLLVEVIKG